MPNDRTRVSAVWYDIIQKQELQGSVIYRKGLIVNLLSRADAVKTGTRLPIYFERFRGLYEQIKGLIKPLTGLLVACFFGTACL